MIQLHKNRSTLPYQTNMNIAIDIDDTLTDSFDYFIPFVAE